MPLVLSAFVLLGAAQAQLTVPNRILEIGPKQDDPRAACGPAGDSEVDVVGGIAPDPENDPHASRDGLAIGPKQDDPRTGPGGLAIGPKQDDPRTGPGSLAIGPKQDDPRAPGVLNRPGDDDDPQARAQQRCAPQR